MQLLSEIRIGNKRYLIVVFLMMMVKQYEFYKKRCLSYRIILGIELIRRINAINVRLLNEQKDIG